MSTGRKESDWDAAVIVDPAPMDSNVMLVCEHASNRVPESLDKLGLSEEALASHIAWDPGALGVAKAMAKTLGAPLVSGGLSRLVYDCNRPPEAKSAIPSKSEIYEIPGNKDLSIGDLKARISNVYTPFKTALSQEIQSRRDALDLIVTIHTFNPTYNGRHRDVELGILHGRDAEFAGHLIATQPQSYVVRLNEPYSALDGVAHTLDVHGADNGLANVMIEIRNDLVTTQAAQMNVASTLTEWLLRAKKNLSSEAAQ